jgi:hypothetical protein
MKKILLLLSIILFSCTSDEEIISDPPKLVVKNEYTDSNPKEVSNYIYNEDNFLMEINVGNNFIIEVGYQNNKIISLTQKSNNSILSLDEYEYLDGNISKYSRYEKDILITTSEYTYNVNDELIIAKNTYSFGTNSNTSINHYTYNSSNNSVKITRPTEPNRYSINFFDQKKHPLSGVEYLKPFIRDQGNPNYNNIIKTETYLNNIIESSKTYVNEYDSDDFLTKSVATEAYSTNTFVYINTYTYNK